MRKGEMRLKKVLRDIGDHNLEQGVGSFRRDIENGVRDYLAKHDVRDEEIREWDFSENNYSANAVLNLLTNPGYELPHKDIDSKDTDYGPYHVLISELDSAVPKEFYNKTELARSNRLDRYFEDLTYPIGSKRFERGYFGLAMMMTLALIPEQSD